MAKTLKFWTGRGYCCRKHGDPLWDAVPYNGTVSISIAAYSRADAVRLIDEYNGYQGRGLDAEIREYFSPRWGKGMEGITPERGIWAEFERGKPTRLI